MMIYGSLLTFSNSIFVLIVAYGKPSYETFTRLISLGVFCIYVIFDHSIYGILNSILLSGFILLIGAIANLYILKILDIHTIFKNFFIYNLPVIGILYLVYNYNKNRNFRDHQFIYFFNFFYNIISEHIIYFIFFL